MKWLDKDKLERIIIMTYFQSFHNSFAVKKNHFPNFTKNTNLEKFDLISDSFIFLP